MCQMCEEYEAELRRMGIPPHQLTFVLDDELSTQVSARAERNGHTIEREIELILREHFRPKAGDSAVPPRAKPDR